LNIADLYTFVTAELMRIQEEQTGKPNGVPELEVISGQGIKITLPEHLPRMAIYSKVVYINNKPFYKAYTAARARWYGLTMMALKGYEGEPITPCHIYVINYTPHICDPDNYSVKFIIDALKHYGGIARKDDCRYVRGITVKMELDKLNPRTEVYVVKDNGQTERQISLFKAPQTQPD